MPRSAAIICTRNRPNELARTIESIKKQDAEEMPLLIVVDASDPESASANEHLLCQTFPPKCVYCTYSDTPSLTRQRNHGLDLLPPNIDIVFFLDDDVTLKPGYFQEIVDLLDRNPEIVGVGGYDLGRHTSFLSSSPRQLTRYFFLLDHPQPGRVLPSGEASPPHRTQSPEPVAVQWLAGFSMTVRRSLLEHERFDERLDGYAHYEDRDLTVRIGRYGRLVTHPQARLIHRRSSKNRDDAQSFNYSMLTHLYWFVEKNVQHTLRKPAFWWSVAGHLLAILFSTKKQKWNALRGLLDGVRAVATRSHPLLQKQ